MASFVPAVPGQYWDWMIMAALNFNPLNPMFGSWVSVRHWGWNFSLM